MKANKNSIHAKLYSFTYTSNLPDNLCPYFWKLVTAVILFIPNFILQLPSHILGLIVPENKEFSCDQDMMKGFIIWFIMVIVSYFLFFNYHLIKAIFHCYSYDQVAAVLGGIVDFVIALVCLIFFVLEWHRNRPCKHHEKKPNIIAEFVKAKKNKYCPKIDWE